MQENKSEVVSRVPFEGVSENLAFAEVGKSVAAATYATSNSNLDAKSFLLRYK